MKAAFLSTISLFLPIPQDTAQEFDLIFLSSKIEYHFQEKGWSLSSKLDFDDAIYHYWKNQHHLVKLSFVYAPSEKVAADRLQEELDGIRKEFGPGNKFQAIGDEAYEWRGLKEGLALVHFRKGRALISLVSKSIDEALFFAREIANLLKANKIAGTAPSPLHISSLNKRPMRR